MLMAKVDTAKFDKPTNQASIDLMTAKYNQAMLQAIHRAKRKIVIWRDILNGTQHNKDGVHFDNDFRMKRCAEVW